MPADDRPDLVLATRANATPWNVSAGIAGGFAVVFLAGLVWAIVAGYGWLLVATLVLLAVSLVMLRYAVVRRARLPRLEVRSDGIALIQPTARGDAVRRSEVDWADVEVLVPVFWRGWSWLGVRCRAGGQTRGPAWVSFDEDDAAVLTTLSAWSVPAGDLRGAIADASGLGWQDDVSITSR